MSNGRFRKRENKFTMISNDALADLKLSTKALGLYCRISYFLNIPDWDLYKNHLMRVSPEGEDAFESMWKELKLFGYLIQHKMQDEKGKIYWEYELSDKAIHTPKNHPMDKPDVEKPPHGKPPSINNNLNNNTLPSNTKHTQDLKTLCVEIQKNVSKNLKSKIIQDLIKEKGFDVIKKYADNWDNYRAFAKDVVNGQDKWFIHCVQNEREIPTTKARPNINKPHENFDQRDYSEDEFESYYANVSGRRETEFVNS